jgi:hypothetical protein
VVTSRRVVHRVERARCGVRRDVRSEDGARDAEAGLLALHAPAGLIGRRHRLDAGGRRHVDVAALRSKRDGRWRAARVYSFPHVAVWEVRRERKTRPVSLGLTLLYAQAVRLRRPTLYPLSYRRGRRSYRSSGDRPWLLVGRSAGGPVSLAKARTTGPAPWVHLALPRQRIAPDHLKMARRLRRWTMNRWSWRT